MYWSRLRGPAIRNHTWRHTLLHTYHVYVYKDRSERWLFTYFFTFFTTTRRQSSCLLARVPLLHSSWKISSLQRKPGTTQLSESSEWRRRWSATGENRRTVSPSAKRQRELTKVSSHGDPRWKMDWRSGCSSSVQHAAVFRRHRYV